MKRSLLLAGGALLALTSTLALAGPESLLPPIFDNPTPAPAPRPSAAPRAAPSSAAPAGPTGSATVVQPLPGGANADPSEFPMALPANLPSIEELEKMDPDELDELFGLKLRYDIPAGARRALRQVGVLGEEEGGLAADWLTAQDASLVRAALAGTKGPLVSRWGHILLRRALASRLDAPQGMDPVEFAALRAALLNRLGEPGVARALVQDVDSGNYNQALASAAFDAYVGIADLVGICPVVRLRGGLREDPQWQLSRAICAAFDGEARSSERDLNRALGQGIAPRIDVLLAQRYAGAAGAGRRAVNIEWDGVDELTPWRLALARALGVEIPASLLPDPGSRIMRVDALIPATPLVQRADVADRAAREGILSAHAMVGLYGQIWAEPGVEGEAKDRADTLRNAYIAAAPSDRVQAIRTLWGNGAEPVYGRQVLTAFAAARLPVDVGLVDDPAPFIASMLAAGLDRNAMRWGGAVAAGSPAWALLALAQPQRRGSVRSDAIDVFIEQDRSQDKRKSAFLVASLVALGRLQLGDARAAASELEFDLSRNSKWSRAIDKAGEYRNPALVALLAGLGMQGSGWDQMTPRHLFHIVRALDRAGLGAEARMIAAEAVARG